MWQSFLFKYIKTVCILQPKSKYNISILFPISLPQVQLCHMISRLQPMIIIVLKKKRLNQVFPVFSLGKNIIISPLFLRKSEVKWPVVRMHHHLAQIKLAHQYIYWLYYINYKKYLTPGLLSVTFKLKTRHLKCTHKFGGCVLGIYYLHRE